MTTGVMSFATGACQGTAKLSAESQTSDVQTEWPGSSTNPCAAKNPVPLLDSETADLGASQAFGNVHHDFAIDLPADADVCVIVSAQGLITSSDKVEIFFDGPKVGSLKACPDGTNLCVLGKGMLLLAPIHVVAGRHTFLVSTKLAIGTTTKVRAFLRGPALSRISTSTARPGDAITLSGEGFTLTTKVSDGTFEYPVTSVSTDGSSLVVVVPDQPPSARRLTLINEVGADLEGSRLLVLDPDPTIDPPFENPTFVAAPDDSVALDSLLEAAGYGADANSDWVDVAGGDLCGGSESELVVLKNSHSYFSIMQGPAPYAVGTSDVDSNFTSGNKWQAVAVGELFGPFFTPTPKLLADTWLNDRREIVAVRRVAEAGAPDLVVLRANDACTISELTSISLGSPAESTWKDVAVGRFDGHTSQIVAARATSPMITVLSPQYDMNSNPTLTKTWEGDWNIPSDGILKMAAGDIDGDGTDELVAAVQSSDIQPVTLIVFKWTGLGFTQITHSSWGVTGGALAGIAIGDFNSDGKAAIAIARNGSPGFSVLSLEPGSVDLKIERTSNLDTVPGQEWRALAAVDWLRDDQGAHELVALRKAEAPYRTDLFVYGNKFHQISRQSGLRNIKGQSLYPVRNSWDATEQESLRISLRSTFTNTYNFWLEYPGDYAGLVEFLKRNTAPDGAKVRVWVTMYACHQADNGSIDAGAFPENPASTSWNELSYFRSGTQLIDRCDDFIGWAGIISRLAQDYPEIVGFSIDDFGDRFLSQRYGILAGDGSVTSRILITDEYVAELVSTLRTHTPWINFIPNIYWSRAHDRERAYADEMPDLGRTFDTTLFSFRNQGHTVTNDSLGCDPEGCSLGAPPSIPTDTCNTCIAGTCAEKTINNAPAEFCDAKRFVGSDRSPILYIYYDGLSACGGPSTRYDYELAALVLENPWLGINGAMYYGMPVGDGSTCRNVNDPLSEDNKVCLVRKAFSPVVDEHDRNRVTHIDLTEAACESTTAIGKPFGWVQNGSGDQNVVYVGDDYHLHELWRAGDRAGGGDLSATANAPRGEDSIPGDPTAWVGADGVTQYITYSVLNYPRTSLHLMSSSPSEGLIDQDLTGSSSVQPADVPFGYAVPSLGRNEIVLRAKDGHIHEYQWTSLASTVQERDLHDAAADAGCPAPDATGAPVGYAFESIPSQNAIFRGADGDMHELYWWTGGVCHTDLSENAGAGEVAGDPSAYVAAGQGFQNVVYRGVDGDAHELYWFTDDVGTSNLTSSLDADPPVADPSAYYTTDDATSHAIYTSKGGALNELWWRDAEAHVSNIQAASQRVPVDDSWVNDDNPVSSAYYNPVDGSQHVIYVGRDGHIHELYWGKR
jgi:hypothetical protein